MKARFVIAMLAVAMICVCAMAQENTTEYWFNKGQELQRNNSNEEAIKAFDKAIDLNKSYAFALGGKGSAMFSMGKYEDAIVAWNKAIAIEHDEFFSGSLWERIGNAQEILGKKNESAIAYKNALELAVQAITKQKTSSDLNLSAAWGFKGILLDDQGRYEEAIEAYGNAAKANPKDAFVLPAIGDILADNLGRYNESLDAYNESLERDPKNTAALRGMGSALTSLGRYEEAIKYSDKAIEIDSGFARAWEGKGDALRNLGKYNESIQAYDKAIELLPQQPTYALIGKGMALDSLGMNKEALEAYNESLRNYDKIVEKNPRNAQVMYNEGNALRGLGRYNESLKAYDRAIELNPRDIDAWRNRGYALKALGHQSEADAAFAKAKALGYLG